MKQNINTGSILLLDGGTGTGLMAAGLPQGVCVENWVLQHPDALVQLQKAYLAAGSNLLLTSTFGANRARLAQYSLQDSVQEMNAALAALTVNAINETAPGKALVAGDVSPTGLFCEPWGESNFDELVAIYTEQISALKDAGVQLVAAETMLTLADARAAVVAARECGLPAIASVTVDGAGRTITGMPCEAAVIALQAAGAIAVGLNCSTGPDDMAALLPRLQKYARIPLLAKPNAGTPEAPLAPGPFAAAASALAEGGIGLLGGCCQSGPAHIAALATLLAEQGLTVADPVAWLCAAKAQKNAARLDGLPLCSENRVYVNTAGDTPLRLAGPFACNDTLEDELAELEADDADAALVHLAIGDDPRCLVRAAGGCALPLVLEAENTAVLTAALRIYCGRAGVICHSEAEAAAAQYWGAKAVVSTH